MFANHMWIDLVFAAFAAYGFYWGYSRGIIRTVISIAGVVVGFVLAVRFSAAVTDVLAQLFKTEPTGALPLIGFVVTFALVLLALRLVANAIEGVLSKLNINFLNQAAGGLAAAILATLALSMMLMLVNSANLITAEAKRKSISYSALEAFPDQAYAILGKTRPALERAKDAGQKAMDKGREAGDDRL